MKRLYLAAALTLLAALPAAGEEKNWLGALAGGLSLPQMDGLEVTAVKAYLAPSKIKVHYELHNAGESALVLRLGFLINASGENLQIPGALMDAALEIDRQKIEPVGEEVRVFMQEIDATSALNAAGIDPETLKGVDIEGLSRLDRRPLERALIDQGIAIKPGGWHVYSERLWEASVGPRSSINLTLSYTPLAGGGFDRYPPDEVVEDLAHLDAYCASEQEGLLAWVQDLVVNRSAERLAQLLALGKSKSSAAADSYADIQLRDLSFRVSRTAWPTAILRFDITIDPEGGRAAFCHNGAAVSPGSDGLYLLNIENLPSDTAFDIIFMQ